MNTDKTITNKFCERKDAPIWFYKQLYPTSVSDVVFNLLTNQSFVVDIDGCKHEITFGKNRKGEISICIRYDEICNSKLTSYDVVEQGFRKGKWYTISDIDTTNEYKEEYIKRKQIHEHNENRNIYIKILKNVVNSNEELSDEYKKQYITYLENATYEELEQLIKNLFNNYNNKGE